MSEISMFWEGRVVGDASLAPYDNDEFTDWINDIVNIDRTTAGVIWTFVAAYQGMLAVSNPAGLTIRVATGLALVDGKLYRNTAAVDNAVVAPGAGSNYYRIVLRKSFAAQTVRVAVLGPNVVAPPAVTQTDGTTWEISLGTVRVTSASVVTVTDTRVYLGQEQMSNSNVLGGGATVVIAGVQHTALGTYGAIIASELCVIAASTAQDCAIIGALSGTINALSARTVIAGGINNTADTETTDGFIGGGNVNVFGITTTACAIVGGSSNTVFASSTNCVIIGGSSNLVANTSSVIIGGLSNTLNGLYSVILGGRLHTLTTGDYSAIIAGRDGSLTTGDYSAIVAGRFNTVVSSYSVTTGRNANATHDGSVVQGGSYFSLSTERGTTQNELAIVSRAVTHNSNAWFTLYLDPVGGSGLLTVPSDSVWTFDVLIAGASQGCAKTFSFRIVGCIENDGGTTAIKGTPTVTVIDDADDVSFDAQAVADDPNDALLIQVRDSDGASDIVRWSASVRITQVVFP